MKSKWMLFALLIVAAVVLWAQTRTDEPARPEPAPAQVSAPAEPAPEPQPDPAPEPQSRAAGEAVVSVETAPQPEAVPDEDVMTVAPAAEDDIETVEVDRALAGQGMITGGLISLNVKGVELSNVIRLFAELSDANIIIPDLQTGEEPVRVDVNLKNVEWKPALQAILDTHDLELYEKVPGTAVYSIREKAADAPEPLSVRLFKLNFATVDAVAEMLKNLVPEPGKISVFPSRNTIVVQSTAANLAEVDDIIGAIDLPRQQVFIEAKFMELTDSASEQLGIDWQVLGGYGVGLNGIGGSYQYTDSKQDGIDNTRTDTINNEQRLTENRYWDVEGNRFENLESEKYLDEDARSINDPDLSRRFFDITPTRLSESLSENLSKSVSELTSLDESTVTRALGATLSADDFRLVLAALKEVGGTKVVSNPKIIVAKEEMATIHIGREKPNVKGTIQTAGDSQSTTTYELDPTERYFKDGIMVDVTPTINTASNITVKIQPTLDRLDTLPFTAPDGTEFYGKTTKKIDTLFSLESGQTAAIGGLTQNTSDDVERKVPLLGNIPLLGRLFRYSSVVEGQNETIIFVTVGLANPEQINMETGLPAEATLARRYDVQARTDRKIRDEEQRLFEQTEAERLADRLETLRAAQQKQAQENE